MNSYEELFENLMLDLKGLCCIYGGRRTDLGLLSKIENKIAKFVQAERIMLEQMAEDYETNNQDDQ